MGGFEDSTDLMLAKVLSDALFPVAYEDDAHASTREALPLLLLLCERYESHADCGGNESCISDSVCSQHHTDVAPVTNELAFVGEHSSESDTSLRVIQQGDKTTKSLPSDPSMVHIDKIKHSQLQCTDIILQIHNTELFVVARRVDGELKIVARLAVVIEEFDGAAGIIASWLPWSRYLTKHCAPLESIPGTSNNEYQLLLDVSLLRRLVSNTAVHSENLTLTCPSETTSTYRIPWQNLRWADESDASCPHGMWEMMRAYFELFRNELRAHSAAATTPDTLSIPQAYQAWRSGKLNIDAPEDFRASPSWKELIGRN